MIQEVKDLKGENGKPVSFKILILEFDDCNIILYFISMADFDEKIYEDDNQYGLNESIETFKNTVYIDQLSKKPILLVFTKPDVLKSKHQKLSRYYKEYKGNTFEEASVFIQQLFIKEFNPKERFSILQGNMLDISFIYKIQEKIMEIICTSEINNVKIMLDF